jgi:hypothetical protein
LLTKPVGVPVDTHFLALSTSEKFLLSLKPEEPRPADSPKMVFVDGTSVINHQLIRFPSPVPNQRKRPLFSRYISLMVTTMEEALHPLDHQQRAPQREGQEPAPYWLFGPSVQRARKDIRDRYVGIL